MGWVAVVSEPGGGIEPAMFPVPIIPLLRHGVGADIGAACELSVYWLGPPSSGDPAKILRPSAKLTDRALAIFESSFAL